MLQTELKVLDNLVVFNLDINLWSARRKLLLEDLGGTDLPPDDLASLGSKKICDPEAIKIFNTWKARAFNCLDKFGIRFLSGWAVPENLAAEIDAEIQKIQAEFNNHKLNFLNDYDLHIQTWLDKHPKWTDIISNSTVSADYVDSKLNFKWQVYKLATSNENQGLQAEVQGLGNTLFNEISKNANEIWQKVFQGKSEISHKALSPLKTMYNKVQGLSFIEPHVLPVAKIIQSALEKPNKRGKILGDDLLAIQGLVCLLRDSKALFEHSQKVLEQGNIDFNFESFLPEAKFLDKPSNILSWDLW